MGGDRVSWGKEWFSDSSRWLIRADFDVRNTWPSPSDHVPRPTIGETLMTSHTAPSHSMAARKEFTLVSKGNAGMKFFFNVSLKFSLDS